MSDDESSEDAFDPSPLPVKRRRLSAQTPATKGNNGSTAATKARKETRLPTRSNESTPAKKRQQKPKHLVHVHADEGGLEDTIHTQLPDLDSSPWRVRGARWKKPEQAIQDKRTQPSPSEITPLPTRNESLDPVDQGASIDAATVITGTEGNQPLRDPTKALTPAEPIKPSIPDFDMDKELADLPSDAFASSPPSSPRSPIQIVGRNLTAARPDTSAQNQGQNSVAPKKNYQQMTLFGDTTKNQSSNSQSNKIHNWPLMSRDEAPTHHKLNKEALKTYVYPTNLGMVRDYQFSIVKRGLYHNLLVALPTGLGKTFIAATIMLNWYRWTEDAQIVFVAPTKPLVAQQVEACFRIAGIPRSHTTMLTGGVPPGLRNEEWNSKRVFFMTPQTIINDLKTGICDPKRIVLLVVDEAHRATGSYAYVEVIKFIRRFNQSFRVLALTATPGNSVETVQEVIDGLDISRVEIRTEFSIDIRQYVHNRNVEQMLFDNTEELEIVMDLFSRSLQPVLNKLRSFNAFWSADPMQLTPYGLTQSRQRWFASPAGRNANAGVKGMIHRMFAVLASLAHNIDLLKYHGIGPFYHNMVSFQKNIDKTAGNKYEKEIAESQSFKEMMTKVGTWVKHDEFIGHPKLEYLQGVILDHFVAAGEGEGAANGEPPSSTRIMIFVHFRDSAEEVVRVLKRHEPMVRPHVFVGQAASKGSEGMDQKHQLEVIQQFKSGTFNVLVATSIGEEGLDIGEIDLIVCYDSSSSPIRMLQRMGRTGRKRAGNIVLLLMRGKEEASFAKAKDNYEKMQRMIAEAKRFTFHEERSKRIIPRETEPVVDKRAVEIPEENTQADFLPEPKKRGKVPKRPPKKFHMPDGVRTGFVSASRLDEDEPDLDNQPPRHSIPRTRRKRQPTDQIELRPPLQEVLLAEPEEKELRSSYQDIQAANDDDIVIGLPDLTAHPGRQTRLAPIKLVDHGLKTRNTIMALKAMHQVSDERLEIFKQHSTRINLQTLNNGCRVIASDGSNKARALKSYPQARKSGSLPISKKQKRRDRTPPEYSTLNAVEGLSSSPAPTDPRLKIHSQGISLGSDTSGEDPQEDEPSSQLRNFVVDNDDIENDTDSNAETDANSSSQSSSSPGGKPWRKARKVDTFASSQQSNLSDDVDSSLPNLRAMLQADPAKAASKVGELAQKRKRRIIQDSSE